MLNQEYFTVRDNNVLLRLKIKANASQNKLKEIKDGRLYIEIKSIPDKGKANKELIKFLSKTFKAAKSNIIIDSGTTSKFKTVNIPLTKSIQFFLKDLI